MTERPSGTLLLVTMSLENPPFADNAKDGAPKTDENG